MGSVEDVNFPQFVQFPLFLHIKDNRCYQKDVNLSCPKIALHKKV